MDRSSALVTTVNSRLDIAGIADGSRLTNASHAGAGTRKWRERQITKRVEPTNANHAGLVLQDLLEDKHRIYV